jgi:membrane protein insertase Oxa1/YidC/SpoIIIJ
MSIGTPVGIFALVSVFIVAFQAGWGFLFPVLLIYVRLLVFRHDRL